MSAFSAIGEEREVERDEFTPGIEPQPTWCPGCGDFAVNNALKGAMSDLGKNPEEVLVCTGIGCSGKLNSYFESYGFHTIHGRPLPVARAAKLANTDLEVVAAGGDGDGYGIGGNHFMHTARENHDMTYIVFNNEVFALTKGQSSPTSPKGHKSKTQPEGNAKGPLRPLSLGLTSGASFVARTAAVNPNQARNVLKRAVEHDGFAHVDFLTQCPTWNKDAKSYVPYYDISDEDDMEQAGVEGGAHTDVQDRRAASEMMHTTEDLLHEGTVLTGVYYEEEGRKSYQQEKLDRGSMSEGSLAERYFDEDADWERSHDLIDRHK